MLPILAEIGAKFQLYGFVDRREFFTDAAPTGLRGGGACFSTEMPPLRGLIGRRERFSTQMLKKSAETPKQKPQANKPYGIQEVLKFLGFLCRIVESGAV